VGPRVGLDGYGKSRPPTGIRSLDRPARSESLYRLSYRGPNNQQYHTIKKYYIRIKLFVVNR
jgi:hypothetical protein